MTPGLFSGRCLFCAYFSDLRPHADALKSAYYQCTCIECKIKNANAMSLHKVSIREHTIERCFAVHVYGTMSKVKF